MIERKLVFNEKRFHLYRGATPDVITRRLQEASDFAATKTHHIATKLDTYVEDHYHDGPSTEVCIVVQYRDLEPEEKYQHRLNEARNQREARRLQYEQLKKEFEGVVQRDGNDERSS